MPREHRNGERTSAAARHEPHEMSTAGHQSIRQGWEATARREPTKRKRSQRAPQVEHLNSSTMTPDCIFTPRPISAACGGAATGSPSNASHSSHVGIRPPSHRSSEASNASLASSRHSVRKFVTRPEEVARETGYVIDSATEARRRQ